MGAFLILLVLTAVLLEKYTLDKGLTGVRFDCRPSKALVEPEETFDIITTVENATRRFFPFIRLREEVPACIQVESGELTGGINGGNARLAHTLYLFGRQRLTRRTKAALPTRGRYLFCGMTVYGGDFLGVSGRHTSVELFYEIVVKPPESERPDIRRALGGFLGDVSVNRFLYEDPVLTVGLREYTGREPRKAISWTQTARAGRLLVRQYDHTLEPSVTVLLSGAGAADMEDGEARMEECFSIARSACAALESARVAYGFASNCITAGMRTGWNDMGAGLGPKQFAAVLEGLGRATFHSRQTLDGLVESAWKRAEPGRAHILIAPQSASLLAPAARTLEARTGGRVLVLTPETRREAMRA